MTSESQVNPYLPLLLPERGEDLQPGRQYLLTPLARLVLREEYGIEAPTVVECLFARRPAVEVTTHRKNLETGETAVNVEVWPAQSATFSAFLGHRRVVKFTLDLAKLEELAPMYDKSHKLPALEEDWFRVRNLPSTTHKFRGQSLRWWSRGGPQGEFQPRHKATPKQPEMSYEDMLANLEKFI